MSWTLPRGSPPVTASFTTTDRAAVACARALRDAVGAPSGTGWNAREDLARRAWREYSPTSDVYLGGDSLSPYVAGGTYDERGIAGDGLVVAERDGWAERLPSLLAAIAGGEFGVARRQHAHVDGKDVRCQRLPMSEQLRRRLAVPSLALVSLTNSQRYRSIRFPLNIARLAQWMRFTHAARVTAIDSALDCGGDIGELAAQVIELRPDVLGVSVNFGETERLASLVAALRGASCFPHLVLGNVLAAWAADDLRRIADDFVVSLAPSYGERFLESLCRSWESPQGNAVVEAHDPPFTDPPDTIVVPDERLLARTVESGGQIGLETSFGCQYGRCTFCPRDHRGKGWARTDVDGLAAVISRMGSTAQASGAPNGTILSIVDEEAFGSEGLAVDEALTPAIIPIIHTADDAGFHCEIYTRLEQILDTRKPADWNLRRLAALRTVADKLAQNLRGGRVRNRFPAAQVRQGADDSPGGASLACGLAARVAARVRIHHLRSAAHIRGVGDELRVPCAPRRDPPGRSIALR